MRLIRWLPLNIGVKEKSQESCKFWISTIVHLFLFEIIISFYLMIRNFRILKNKNK